MPQVSSARAKETERSLDTGKGGNPILVLDESPEILSLIEIVLREDGFAVLTATSNKEALKKAELAMPALVLLDIGLVPAKDEEFVAALHDMYGSRVPIVVVSAVGERSFQSAVRRTGAVDGIHKPFDIDDLLVRVHRADVSLPPSRSVAFAALAM